MLKRLVPKSVFGCRKSAMCNASAGIIGEKTHHTTFEEAEV
jgi:hypothetical protein